MKFSVFSILVAGQAAQAIAMAMDSAAQTIGAAELKWNGAIDSSGVNVTLTGTAESIFKQIIALNPNYEQERGIDMSGTNRRDGLTKRDAINSDSILCSVFNNCEWTAIRDGISYLRGIGDGTCSAPPGRPGSPGCARVSCSWNAGIFLCNDQDFEARIPCRLIADNAQGILNTCHFYGGTNSIYTHGQIWSFNRAWNVVINADNC